MIYGMGPQKLARTLGISLEEAKDLLKRYFAIFRKVKKTMDELTAAVKINKYAYSPLDGRRRDLSTIDWDDPKLVAHAVNQAKNLPFQGAGASVTKLAMCRIHNKFKNLNLDAKILLTVHDEIVCSAHKDIADQVALIVETEMKAAFNYFAPSVEMEVEAQVGDFWLH